MIIDLTPKLSHKEAFAMLLKGALLSHSDSDRKYVLRFAKNSETFILYDGDKFFELVDQLKYTWEEFTSVPKRWRMVKRGEDSCEGNNTVIDEIEPGTS